MSDDRKRTYQTLTTLPTLRTHIAVPPLKMVLVNDRQSGGSDPMDDPADNAKGQNALNVPASKERIVRRIIEHLEKDS